jgi:hypothetical protein
MKWVRPDTSADDALGTDRREPWSIATPLETSVSGHELRRHRNSIEHEARAKEPQRRQLHARLRSSDGINSNG